MPSPFQKYQSEQVQQIAPGFVEAYGRAGAAIGQGLAQAGQAVVQGYEEAKKKAEEDAVQKGALAPYLQRDKAKIEAGVKAGSLIKNPDGTVSINPQNPNKDMMDTSAIDFYNKTGGDIDKLAGVDLKRFVAAFESKKKIEAQEREAALAEVDLNYKRAQTLKLTTDAELAKFEMGQATGLFSAMGFGNRPYAPADGSTIPTVPGSPPAPGAVVTPNLSSYTGTGTKMDTNGLPTYSADAAFFASLARIDATMKQGTSTTAPAAAPAATTAAEDPALAVPPASPEEMAGRTKEELSAFNKADAAALAAAANRIGMSERDLAAAAKGMGMTPAEYAQNYLGETPTAPAKAAPAVSPALTAGTTPTPAPAAAAPAAAPVAQTPVTSGQFVQSTTEQAKPAAQAQPSVEEIAASVQANVQKLTTRRIALATERDAAVNKAQIAADQQRQNITIPGKNTALAQAVLGFQERTIKNIRDNYDGQISSIDAQIKLEETRLTTAKAGSAAVKGKAEEKRAVAAEVRAETAATEAKRVAARKVIEEQREDFAIFPQYGPFAHIGHSFLMRGKEPTRLGIGGLTDATQRQNVRELADGWMKSTDFILGMDDTLENRNMQGQDYMARMRLFTEDMNNWAQGELQQIFGVATFRKAIVSGGNFSDSDRIFVQRAIAYINSLDPLNDKEVYKAQIDALAGFIDNMYRRGLNAYDMKFDPKLLDEKATLLEKEGEPDAAEFIRKQAEDSRRFMDRFGINAESKRVFDPEAVDKARSVLWNALESKGLLKDADAVVRDSAGNVVMDIDGKPIKLRSSAPRSK